MPLIEPDPYESYLQPDPDVAIGMECAYPGAGAPAADAFQLDHRDERPRLAHDAAGGDPRGGDGLLADNA